MKKLLSLAIIASLFLVACGSDDSEPAAQKQEQAGPMDVTTVKKENQSMVVKFSGTNCPPCGTWGWSTMETLVSDVKGEGFAMTAYGQNFVARNYIISAATTLQDAWGASGYPHFGANGSLTTVPRSGSVNVAAEIQEIQDRISDHSSAEVKANTTLKYEIVDGKITMNYRSAAFTSVSNPYLAIYVLENKVEGFQAGHPDSEKALHKYVLRAEATAGAGYGSEIEGLSVGNDVSGSVSIDVDGEWNADNLSIGVVMYSKDGDTYNFINASQGELVE